MSKYLTLFFYVLLPLISFSQKDEKFHKVKINYNSTIDLVKIANKGVVIDHGLHKKNHFFISDFSNSSISLKIFSRDLLFDAL